MKDRRVGIEFFYFLEIYFKSTFELAHGGTGFPLGDYGQIKTEKQFAWHQISTEQ